MGRRWEAAWPQMYPPAAGVKKAAGRPGRQKGSTGRAPVGDRLDIRHSTGLGWSSAPRLESITVGRITLRVLGYRDRDGWVAHCLETDLVGQGRSYAAARRHLVELTKLQLSFATQMKDPRLFFRPAPQPVLARYERLCSKLLV